MGYGFILTGLIFLFNPTFNLLDLLPDFIGCIFIIKGLSKLSELDGNLESSKRTANYMLWMSVVKLLLAFWTNMGHRDYAMPFTFMFSILEIILMLSFFRNLYSGIEYTANRNPSSKILPVITSASTFSIIFVVGTRLLDFAPQVLDLMAQNDEVDLRYNASYKMSPAQVKPYFMAACIVCSLILGVIFIITTVKFFSQVIKDREYNAALDERYRTEILTNRSFLVRKALGRAYFLLMCSLGFFLDFAIDGINILPNLAGFILIYFACSELSKLESKRMPKAAAIAGIIISAANYAYMTLVNLGVNYAYDVETFNAKRFTMLENSSAIYVTAALTIAEGVLFLLLVFRCLSLMKDIFLQSKRSSGAPCIRTAKGNAVIMILLCSARKILTPILGNLACNETVAKYISAKSAVRSMDEFKLLRSDPLIARFENLDSFAYVLGIIAVLFVLWNIFYLIRLNRSTEG